MIVVAILLDRSEENIFYAGQIVNGNVRVETNEEVKMRGIRLEVHGAAAVHWSEGAGKNSRSYSGAESFIDLKLYLAGSENNISEMILQPGDYTYPLSFVLPDTAPSTFDDMYGSIKYRVQAIIDRPWRTDVSTEIFITVVRWLNLNYESPQLREPIVMSEGKPVVGYCCPCCCIKGRPDIELRMNRGCFVPGEIIVINGQLVNRSNTKIEKTTINFMQEIQFCANFHNQIYKTTARCKTLYSLKRPQVEVGGIDTWSDVSFTVPPVVASRLDGCSIININYFIQVKADFLRGCARSEIRQEVIIGHVPLQGVSQLGGPITTQPPAYTTSPPPLQSGAQFHELQSNYIGVHGPGWNQDFVATSADSKN